MNKLKCPEKQVFESSFFQLLAAHSRIVEGITTPYYNRQELGRDAFTLWYTRLIKEFFAKAKEEYPDDEGKAIETAFGQLYAIYRTDLGHYFRSLYNLIKFVDAAELNHPRVYTNLVRAQMSDQEVLILFYNCLTQRGSKFRPLVEKFSLLKHLNPDDLCSPEHAKLYDNTAYGRND